jgi:hypothetical protein
MKYDYILAFGGSHTAGCELIPDSVDWDETKLLSFPNTLAKKLNIPCINYAWPGGSNDRSLRLLPEALLTHPNSLVLFGYVTFVRTEFFTLDKTMPQDKDGYIGIGPGWSQIKTYEKHQRLNKLYYSEFYEDETNFNRYKQFNTMLSVQLLCQQYAKNYFQFFQDNTILFPPDYQQSVYDAIDKKHIYQFDFANDNISWKNNNSGFGSLTNWAKNKKYPFCPGSHIGQEAHDNFALELYSIV